MLALETALEAAETLGLALSQSQSASWRHAAEKLKLQLAVFDGRRLHKEYDEYLLRRMLVDQSQSFNRDWSPRFSTLRDKTARILNLGVSRIHWY